MPRAAWLAIGAAAAALALPAGGSVVVLLAGSSLLLAASGFRFAGRPGLWRRLAPIAVGVVAIGLRGATGAEPSPPGLPPAGTGAWVGTVQSVSAPRAGARPAIVLLDGGPQVIVAATLPWYPPVEPGDRVGLTGRIRPPPEDDYGAYLARIGAVGTLRADELELLPVTGSLAGQLEDLRRAAAEGLDRAIPEPEAGLAAGVLIGLRDRVDRDLAAAFTTAGASHVVAISGWNIAIVASTLAAIGGRLQRRRRVILTAVAIVLYIAFVGPSASVVRAGVMAGVALLARELGRPGTAAAALGWAVTGLLLLDPAWIDDAGFRLSVLATAGIIAWGSSMTERLAGPAPGRVRRWLAEILGVSLAAQAATTPIVLLEFGRLSLVAPAVNLIVVPLVPPAMAAGTLALGAGLLAGLGLPSILAVLVGLPAWALYAAMVGAVRIGAGLPMASVELGPPWDAISAAVSLVAILAVARWGGRLLAARAVARAAVARHRASAAAAGSARRSGRGASNRGLRAAVIALCSSIVGLALVVAYRPDGIARVVVLDVGQGDGILVEGGRGGRMVVDGGPDPGRLLIALDERLPPWDRRIDLLVLTHPHEDHVAGLALLLQRYRVGRVYEPGMLGPGPGYDAWASVFADGGPPRGRLATGDQLTLDSIRLRVLWPDANRVPEQPSDTGTGINNVSIVLLGEVAGRRFLLAGDIEEGVDPELLARGLPAVDLLKVAHHGSGTASTREFLEAVRPSVAVVSAGAGNPYGHPAQSTLERLGELAGRRYRTDTDGAVEIALEPDGLRVRTSGPRPVRPRATPARAGTASLPTAPLPAATFLCGIRPRAQSSPSRPVAEPPVAPEAPRPPVLASLGRPGPGPPLGPSLGRPPDPKIGARTVTRYHRPDANRPVPGDRVAARDRSPRLLLGRRRVRPRGGARRVPQRLGSLPQWAAGALAPRGRAHRARPPPRRDSRAARDGLDVRRGQRRDPARRRWADPEQ
jgi:competence protein ComEC